MERNKYGDLVDCGGCGSCESCDAEAEFEAEQTTVVENVTTAELKALKDAELEVAP